MSETARGGGLSLDIPDGSARRERWWLVALLLLGLGLRLWGIDWGLPERRTLHPDEYDFVVNHALEVSLRHPDPGFLNYPSFLCYSIAIVHKMLFHLGVGAGEPWRAHLVGRVIVAIYGTLTAGLASALARRLGAGMRGRLLAALWVTILPLSVSQSRIAVTDLMMTFWVLATIVSSIDLAERPTVWGYARTGLLLGLSVGSKYTAAYVVVAPLTALLLRRVPLRSAVPGLALLGVASFAACFVVTPFSFIRFRDLLAAIQHEEAHVHGHHIGFSVPAAGWQYHRYLYQVVAAWPFSYGYMLYFSVVAGLVWVLVRQRPNRWPVLVFALVFFGVTGSWSFTPLRYYMPLVAIGAVFAALWQAAWWDAAAAPRRWVARVAVAAGFAYTLALSVSQTFCFTRETRVEALQWARQHMATNETLHIIGWSRYAGEPERPNIHIRGHTEAYISECDRMGTNNLVEVSSLNYLRWMRHANTNYVNVYYHLKDTNYFEQVAIFDRPFLDRHLYGRLDPMFRCYFISPTLIIYRPRGVGPPAPAAASVTKSR